VAEDAMKALNEYHDMMRSFIDRTDSILDVVEEKLGLSE
jgi:hypothetical protein